MKNIRLGIKIGGGFGVLILITCALGALAVSNMKGVEGDPIRLANISKPENSTLRTRVSPPEKPNSTPTPSRIWSNSRHTLPKPNGRSAPT